MYVNLTACHFVAIGSDFQPMYNVMSEWKRIDYVAFVRFRFYLSAFVISYEFNFCITPTGFQ